MPIYGLLIVAATASGVGLGGGGNLFGARFPGVDSNPSAMLWQPRYWIVAGLTRTLPHPDLDGTLIAADPGRGFVGASAGAHYRYRAGEQHLVGGAAHLGLRLGKGLGIGFGGGYQPDRGWGELLSWGLTYALWPRRYEDGNEPGLILGLDQSFAALGGAGWRASLAWRPFLPLRLGFDHRFDGSNKLAAQWVFRGWGSALAGMAIDSNYGLERAGFGVRWHDRGGWIGLAWSRAAAVNMIAFELATPIGAPDSAAR